MKNYRKTGNGLSSQAFQLKKRIARNRRRSIGVGLFYLLGTIGLMVAVAILPMFKGGESYTAMKFYEAFLNMDLASTAGITQLVSAVLYTVMLLVGLIGVIKALVKFKWLFKKKANQEHGFNRNAYAAMEMADAFAATFIAIVLNYFLIAFCNKVNEFEMLFAIVLGVGAVFHFIGCICGAKISFYDIHEGQLLEQTRIVGRFAPFVRNLLQIAGVIAIMHFLLKINTTMSAIHSLLGDGGVDMISAILIAVVIVCLIPLVKHAFDNTEYNMDGYEGAGMKTFRVFAFFVFLLAVGVALYDNFVVGNELNTQLLIVAGIAFVSFLVEIIMRKRPKFPDEVEKKKAQADDGEMAIDAFSQTYANGAMRNNGTEGHRAKATVAYAAAPQTTVNTAGQTLIGYPQPQPYPMPYPVPYPQAQQPVRPMPMPAQQQPLMPYPGMMMGNGSNILPLMAGMAMLPSVMNGLGYGQHGQPMNMQVQNTSVLPSQAMREALSKNSAARAAAEKILEAEDMKLPPKAQKTQKSNKQRRKEQAEREKAFRKMQRPVMAEERFSVVEPVAPNSIVEEKTTVEESAIEEEKIIPAPVLEENGAVAEEEDEFDSASFLDDTAQIKIDVVCPCCKKKLRVTSVALYNRCPGCKTVFQVRRTK